MTNREIVKRLEPLPDTKRALFLQSGNLCAFPNCGKLMMNVDGEWIGQICHIEAAEAGGERFNSNMTNETRRHESNLMLMCYEHHIITNNVQAYPVSRMQEIKNAHKERFFNPDFNKLATVKDSTLAAHATKVSSLIKLHEVRQWPYTAPEAQEMISELNEYIETFKRIPLATRQFLGLFAMRMHYLGLTGSLFKQSADEFMHVIEVGRVFQLESQDVRETFSQLEMHHLARIEEVSVEGVYPPFGAFLMETKRNGWNIWRDIAHFCDAQSIDIIEFSCKMNFALLD